MVAVSPGSSGHDSVDGCMVELRPGSRAHLTRQLRCVSEDFLFYFIWFLNGKTSENCLFAGLFFPKSFFVFPLPFLSLFGSDYHPALPGMGMCPAK